MFSEKGDFCFVENFGCPPHTESDRIPMWSPVPQRSHKVRTKLKMVASLTLNVIFFLLRLVLRVETNFEWKLSDKGFLSDLNISNL